jgi:phosphatidylglycerophosphate synthase
MVVVIVLRESVVTGLRLFALTRNIVLPAQEGGKQKTASQMTAIFVILVSLVLGELGVRFPSEAIYILMLITTALTLISGASFLYRNRAIFSPHLNPLPKGERKITDTASPSPHRGEGSLSAEARRAKAESEGVDLK